MKMLVSMLREIAAELKPFAGIVPESPPGTLVWDGETYAKAGKPRPSEAVALAWWTTLKTAADLLEAQESPLSSRQISYLQGELFGGMGSLQDFSLDPNRLGSKAIEANERVAQRLRSLFSHLESVRK